MDITWDLDHLRNDIETFVTLMDQYDFMEREFYGELLFDEYVKMVNKLSICLENPLFEKLCEYCPHCHTGGYTVNIYTGLERAYEHFKWNVKFENDHKQRLKRERCKLNDLKGCDEEVKED